MPISKSVKRRILENETTYTFSGRRIDGLMCPSSRDEELELEHDMRLIQATVPLIDEQYRVYYGTGIDEKVLRSPAGRKSKISVRNRWKGSMLLLVLLFTTVFLSGIIALVSPLSGIKIRLQNSGAAELAKALSFRNGLPSPSCHSVRPALGLLYTFHWMQAFTLFRTHAPGEVLNRMPEFGTEAENFYTNATKKDVLSKYLRVRYSTFFPGFTAVRSRIQKPGMHYIYYSRIYKAGNDAIRENLAKASRSPARMVYRWSKRIPASIFTFVRDPAERWVAGYNELEHRWGVQQTYNVTKGCPKCSFHRFPLGENRVWAFLGDLLLMRLEKTFEIEHVYPMSGILRAMDKIDFVGRIERFDEDWDIVLRDFVGPIAKGYTFDHNLGLHNSSGYVAQKYGLQVLEQSTAFAKILQHILFKDYVCFGYPLRVPIDLFPEKSQSN